MVIQLDAFIVKELSEMHIGVFTELFFFFSFVLSAGEKLGLHVTEAAHCKGRCW